MAETRNIQVIKDLDGRNIVIINDIIFKGKKYINWKDVEAYLKRYVGDFYEINESKDIVYIGEDLPKEYSYSKYSYSLNKPYKRIKSNLISAIPEVIETTFNKDYRENYKYKHKVNAKLGWYRYEIRFGFPIFDNAHNIVKYNIYGTYLIVRRDYNGKMFLYDIVKIKKETS